MMFSRHPEALTNGLYYPRDKHHTTPVSADTTTDEEKDEIIDVVGLTANEDLQQVNAK